MKETNNSQTEIFSQRANEWLKKEPLKTASQITEARTLKLIHEIDVQQIKLIVLNEELKMAQEQTKVAIIKYTELYDFAPSGYFTLSKEGNIIELNLNGAKMLGRERSLLKNSPFIFFVSDDSRSLFNFFLEKVIKTKAEETCEVTLFANDNLPMCVFLTGNVTEDGEHCFVTAVNITDGKLVENDARKAHEKLEATLDALPDLLFEVGSDGYCYDYHSPCTTLPCMPVGNIIGKTIPDIFPPLVSDVVMSSIKEAHDKGFSFGKQFEMDSPIGSLWFEISGSRKVITPDEFYLIILLRDITKRKKAEEALLRNEAINRKMIANIGDVLVIIDQKGIISYKSQNVEKWFGWKAEEAIGTSVWENIYPDDLDAAQNFIGTLKEEPDATGKIEFRYQCMNGRYKWIEFTAVNLLHDPVIQGILGNYHDITERMQAEKQFKLLNRAIEQSPVTVVITDKEGNIEYANPKFTEVTGYSMDEIEGKNPRFLQSGEQSREFYKNLWETILSGNDWHGEFQNRKKNGDIYWESAVISSIVNNQGDIAFFFAVKEDITEKKKMLEDLINAKEKAEESNRLQSAFLANLSHEIRTPMNGILGFTGLLNEPTLTGEEQQEYISIIEKSGARMLNTINDIIDISKIESGLIKTVISETNINELIEYIFSFFKPMVEQKGILFSFKNSLPIKEANINTDPEKVYVIMSNLVKNAIKFTKEGSIEIGYNPGTTVSQDELIFYVKDTGIGIVQEKKNIIFERFRQASESLSRNYEGSGLGLSISKAYVEMLGGRISVESQEGKGSVFYFTIPYFNCPTLGTR